MKKALFYLSIPLVLWGASSCNNGEYDASKAKHTTVIATDGSRLDRVMYDGSSIIKYRTSGKKSKQTVYKWTLRGNEVFEIDTYNPAGAPLTKTEFPSGADLDEVSGTPNIENIVNILNEQDDITRELNHIKREAKYTMLKERKKEGYLKRLVHGQKKHNNSSYLKKN